MKHTYRIVLRDGTVHWGTEVDHVPGFVNIKSWDGEIRLPAADVVEVYSSRMERISWVVLWVAVVFFVLVMLFLIVSSL